SGTGVGCSTDAAGVGVLTFTFSTGRVGFLSAAIWSKRGFTTTKNKPARAPPPSSRNSSTPAMIQGTFDFFFATGCGGNGVDGAACGNGADSDGVATTGGATTSPVVRCGGCSTGGGGGATGGGGGGTGREMSDVFGADPAGPVV